MSKSGWIEPQRLGRELRQKKITITPWCSPAGGGWSGDGLGLKTLNILAVTQTQTSLA